MHTHCSLQSSAEDPPFLTQHEGQVLFTALSLSLYSHSCSLPVISLAYFVPHLAQKHLCRSPLWHLTSVVLHPWSETSCLYYRALLKNHTYHKPKRNGLLWAYSLEKLGIEWGPQWFLSSSKAEVFCKNIPIQSPNRLSLQVLWLQELSLHKCRLPSVSPGLIPCVRQKECLSSASKSDALSH